MADWCHKLYVNLFAGWDYIHRLLSSVLMANKQNIFELLNVNLEMNQKVLSNENCTIYGNYYLIIESGL